MIAALFVEKGGCYYGLPGVDPWDRDRDARFYRGPHPIVAHPPCERWGRFATWHGGVLGDDGGLFASALRSLVLNGGVIEHPAHSKAWDALDLPRPDRRGGWRLCGSFAVCQVEQGHYGHVARKPTWLLACGDVHLPDLVWGPAEQRLPTRRLAERGYASARRCGAVANMSSRQRQRTPLPFRDVLLGIVGR